MIGTVDDTLPRFVAAIVGDVVANDGVLPGVVVVIVGDLVGAGDDLTGEEVATDGEVVVPVGVVPGAIVVTDGEVAGGCDKTVGEEVVFATDEVGEARGAVGDCVRKLFPDVGKEACGAVAVGEAVMKPGAGKAAVPPEVLDGAGDEACVVAELDGAMVDGTKPDGAFVAVPFGNTDEEQLHAQLPKAMLTVAISSRDELNWQTSIIRSNPFVKLVIFSTGLIKLNPASFSDCPLA